MDAACHPAASIAATANQPRAGEQVIQRRGEGMWMLRMGNPATIRVRKQSARGDSFEIPRHRFPDRPAAFGPLFLDSSLSQSLQEDPRRREGDCERATRRACSANARRKRHQTSALHRLRNLGSR